MAKRLVLIHTANSVATIFEKLSKEIMPSIKVLNIVDETLLLDTIANKGLFPDTAWRLAEHIKNADRGGADVVMITCSSVSSIVDVIKHFVNIPVLRVDEPMVDKAVQIASRIGIVATLSTTLNPTCKLINSRASMRGKDIDLKPLLCEGAFDAFLMGKVEKHDVIVKKTIFSLMKKVEVVLLAQASMSRVVDNMFEEDITVPILTSPRLGMEWVKSILDKTSE